MNTPEEQKDWEESFHAKFVNHGEFIYNTGSYPATCGEIKNFIKEVISSTKKQKDEEINEAYHKGLQDGYRARNLELEEFRSGEKPLNQSEEKE